MDLGRERERERENFEGRFVVSEVKARATDLKLVTQRHTLITASVCWQNNGISVFFLRKNSHLRQMISNPREETRAQNIAKTKILYLSNWYCMTLLQDTEKK